MPGSTIEHFAGLGKDGSGKEQLLNTLREAPLAPRGRLRGRGIRGRPGWKRGTERRSRIQLIKGEWV